MRHRDRAAIAVAAPVAATPVGGRQEAGASSGRASQVARLRRGTSMPRSRTMRRLVGTVGLVTVVLLAGALTGCTPIPPGGTTPGGTASVTLEHGDYVAANILHFDAVSGRNNSITVSLGSQGPYEYPSSLLLKDTRNAVAAGSGCTGIDLNTVRCDMTTTSIGFLGQEIGLGDGDDTFASAVSLASDTRVDAGAGNDTVNGGAGRDFVDGFAGDDVLSGGAGDDVLRGGEGFDALDGGTETDFCDVGPDGGTTVNCEPGP
jgi:hypothetical protein